MQYLRYDALSEWARKQRKNEKWKPPTTILFALSKVASNWQQQQKIDGRKKWIYVVVEDGVVYECVLKVKHNKTSGNVSHNTTMLFQHVYYLLYAIFGMVLSQISHFAVFLYCILFCFVTFCLFFWLLLLFSFFCSFRLLLTLFTSFALLFRLFYYVFRNEIECALCLFVSVCVRTSPKPILLI